MKPIDALLDKILYAPVERVQEIKDGLPYTTHSGVLKIGDCELTIYVLNTGQRVINEDDILKFIHMEGR